MLQQKKKRRNKKQIESHSRTESTASQFCARSARATTAFLDHDDDDPTRLSPPVVSDSVVGAEADAGTLAVEVIDNAPPVDAAPLHV